MDTYPHLDNLLTNNDPPSEPAMLTVKELLAASLKEVEELDEEIKRLEVLKARRDTIQNFITKYSAIISPVRRLPPEVIHEIFYFCMPTHRNPILSASEAPVLLTRICSTWRSISLSSPRLWAQLHIPFTDEDRSVYTGPYQPGYPRKRDEAIKMLKLRCIVVEEWLSRSGTCPLSISVSYFTKGDWDSHARDLPHDLIYKLLKTLVRFSPRWRDLQLVMPLEVYCRLEYMVSVERLSMLTSLKVHFSQESRIASYCGPVELLTARNLEKITFYAADSRLWRYPDMPIPNMFIASDRFTYLCCFSELTINETFNLLKYSPNLVHCQLFKHDGDHILNRGPDIEELILLPHLRSLCLSEGHQNPPQMGNIYNCIEAPVLKWIQYKKSWNQRSFVFDLTPSPILSLLQKSTKLRKLTLDNRSLSVWDLRRAFQILSNYDLTHLVIGPEPLGSSRLMPRELISKSRLDEFNFFNFLDVSGNDGQEIILPKLQIVEVTYGAGLSDKDLLQFTSRMNPSSPNGVAVLNSVRVLFSRLREKNSCIAEDVSRLAKNYGIRVNLELDYWEFRLTSDDPISSSFGLSGGQGQTWNLHDIN